DRKYKQGEALVERKLADELGVSRTPIRIALSKLEQEGLVTSIPNVGTFLETIKSNDLAEIYDLREIIEGLAVRYLARRITKDQAGGVMELAEKADAPSASLGDDEAFHAAMVEMCGSSRVAEAVRIFGLHVLTCDERTHKLSSNPNLKPGPSMIQHSPIAQNI